MNRFAFAMAVMVLAGPVSADDTVVPLDDPTRPAGWGAMSGPGQVEEAAPEDAAATVVVRGARAAHPLAWS